MKRLSKHEKWKKAHLAILRRKKHLRRVNNKPEGENKQNIRIDPPEIFSFSRNYHETVTCLTKLKDAVKKDAVKNESYKKIAISIDLSKIKEIQPAAALVLAAELDRWQRIGGKKLKPNKLGDWNDKVFKFLYNLGLFKLLDIAPKEYKKKLKKINDNKTQYEVALQFITGLKNNREPTERLADRLSEEIKSHIPEFAQDDTRMSLNVALAEATLNSVHHAYPNGKSIYKTDGKRWWAAACYYQEEDKKTVRFIAYDQGVGIAQTLETTPFGENIIKKLTRKFSDYPDGELIKRALKFGVSSTKQKNRGQGLKNIVDAAKTPNSSLRLLSGKGCVNYSFGGSVMANSDEKLHLGGTLLEWTYRF